MNKIREYSKGHTEKDDLLVESQKLPIKLNKPSIHKKCLLIGINYVGTSNQLNGCINDTVNMRDFLIKNKYMKMENITMMNDTCKGDLYPTKANMIKQLNLLVNFSNQHKDETVHLFVAYSGHGSFMIDYNKDEADGKDEVLCPVDCSQGGGRYIKDDWLKSEFIDKLPVNVKLVIMIDACHSKTMIDLKYSFKDDKFIDDANISYECKCSVVSLCGCRDFETSADAYIKNNTTNRYEYAGAMSASFLAIFKDGISYKDLINGMREWIKKGKYTQVPQLQSGGYVDANSQFMLETYND
uniref:Caspase domain protein n=1 Tax=Mimivirus LCMiAC01 TaxID=2506608 RepID=A0A481Z1I4_9VIRU|nr:MAG: caspase domain protein [Mimivirus LCMiAC01]